ncbi:MAG: outer membrane beta-barrel protein [Thalassotalea sp.]|nr:outer membrane beta-barrel protein [Thalassotalea sp.]MDG2392285.1 outer membrane beta-barrel protein [Thalassotalea sp.]
MKKSLLATAFALSLALPSTAMANLYIGAGVYESDNDEVSTDDTVPAFFVGYNLLDTNIFMFSVEAGYYDLGDYSVTVNGNTASSEVEAITLAGVAYLPIGPIFEVYAKAGVSSTSGDVTINGFKKDVDGEEAFGGVGASLDILDTIDVYVEYLVFDNEVESELVGAGVRFAF